MKCNAWSVYIFNVSSTKKKRIYLIYLKYIAKILLRQLSDISDKSVSLIISGRSHIEGTPFCCFLTGVTHPSIFS